MFKISFCLLFLCPLPAFSSESLSVGHVQLVPRDEIENIDTHTDTQCQFRNGKVVATLPAYDKPEGATLGQIELVLQCDTNTKSTNWKFDARFRAPDTEKTTDLYLEPELGPPTTLAPLHVMKTFVAKQGDWKKIYLPEMNKHLWIKAKPMSDLCQGGFYKGDLRAISQHPNAGKLNFENAYIESCSNDTVFIRQPHPSETISGRLGGNPCDKRIYDEKGCLEWQKPVDKTLYPFTLEQLLDAKKQLRLRLGIGC